jgi:pilus assembly protein Flp/PilA
MKKSAVRVYVQLQALQFALMDESGQDMVEYALVIGLIALGAVAATSALATSIGSGFTSVGGKVNSSTS